MPLLSSTRVAELKEEKHELRRSEILHFLRGMLEAQHRDAFYSIFLRMFAPDDWTGSSLHASPCSPDGARDCTNKTVPIYVVNVVRAPLERDRVRALPCPAHLSLYACLPAGVASPEVVKDIVILSTSICKRVEATLRDLRNISFRNMNTKPLSRSEQRLGQFPQRFRSAELDKSELYILQPLFRAVAITLLYDDYDDRGSNTMVDLPVLLILTGVESSLSAPITFDAIEDKITARIDGSSGHGKAVRATLDAAIEFVMALERREIKAFGLRPKPARAARIVDSWYAGTGKFDDYSEIVDSRYYIREGAERLGWREE
ncbi:hypothetical protein B0T19DRAFT_403001 [Cercophora scortea]|uniref:Uncharacterized protein n=1 Tax=Cercophora scortea TaxID=314031 RepID=A0AAE0IGS1_9PEZI|nr:hypothetical protein B0T19DRAFT_403001 [Cercophora scortea]